MFIYYAIVIHIINCNIYYVYVEYTFLHICTVNTVQYTVQYNCYIHYTQLHRVLELRCSYMCIS